MGFKLPGNSQLLENVAVHLGGSGVASRQWGWKIGIPWFLAQCAVGETNEVFPLLEGMGRNHRCGFDELLKQGAVRNVQSISHLSEDSWDGIR